MGLHGNITANLNVGSAQLVQDTTHSDNLAVGDDFDWQFSDTGINYSYDFYSCDFTSTNGDCMFACATDDPVTSINTSVTAYYGLAGSLDTLQSTEANSQVTVNNAFKFSQLTCNVTSNSITNTTFINLRANAGNTGVYHDSNNHITKIHKHTNLKLEFIRSKEGIFIDRQGQD